MDNATRDLLARISRVAIMRDRLRALGLDVSGADYVLDGMVERLRGIVGTR